MTITQVDCYVRSLDDTSVQMDTLADKIRKRQEFRWT